MDLHAQARDLDADIGAPGLEQRHQHLRAETGVCIAQGAAIDLTGGVIEQRASALGQRLHP